MAAENWREVFAQRLPVLGHRNWIIVADAAFPLQISPGVETVYTDDDLLPVLDEVLKALDGTRHVRPIVRLDAELKYVPEQLSPGADAFRAELQKRLAKRGSTPVLHEELIKRIDEVGKMFRILMLKTKLTIPYTTVFLELDCGYWGPEEEKKMRALMPAAKPVRK